MKSFKKCFVLCISFVLFAVLVCPQIVLSDVINVLHIDEDTGIVTVEGYVGEYVSGVDEAYIIVPKADKSFQDFAASADTAALMANVMYVGVAPVSHTGRYYKSFTVNGISGSQAVYLSYNGVVSEITESDDVFTKQISIDGTVEYISGYDTITVRILDIGFTYDDYVANGDEIVVNTFSDIPVSPEGKFELNANDADLLTTENIVVFEYAGAATYRNLRAGEIVYLIYVDQNNGNNSNSGISEDKALECVSAAESIYTMRIKNDGYSAAIIMCGGTYTSLPLPITPADGAFLAYRGIEGEETYISGMTRLDITDFRPITDLSVLQKIRENVRDNVYEIDLNSYGLTASDITRDSRDWTTVTGLPIVGVYLNGNPQNLAQWPNTGYLTTNLTAAGDLVEGSTTQYTSYTFTDSEVNNWFTSSDDAFLEGFFCINSGGGIESQPWVRTFATVSDINPLTQTVEFNRPGYTAARVNTASNVKFKVCNLIEEIDIPGEWYIDKNTMKMYYYKPDGLMSSDVLEIAAGRDPVLSASNISNYRFENLHFKGSHKELISLTDVENIKIRNCILEASGFGIFFKGKNNVIDQNAFYNIKGTAIRSNGGANPTTWEESANIISNNHMYHCAYVGTHGANNATATIRLYSNNEVRHIGDIIENNVVHGNNYGQAVMYSGMENKIRYNEFYNLLHNMSDAGVIYTGARLNHYGNNISYNYIHDFSNTLFENQPNSLAAIYWDDYDSGQIAENNIVISDGNSKSRALLAVGKNNTVRNNIAVNMGAGFVYSDRGATNFTSNSAYNSLSSSFVTDAMNARYPQILQSKEDILNAPNNKFVPSGNISYGSLHVNVNRVTHESTVCTEAGSDTYRFNLTTNSSNYLNTDSKNNTTARITGGLSDVFVDPDNHDWRIKDSFVSTYNEKLSPNLITESNFDMDKIGLQRSAWDNHAVDTSFNLLYPHNSQIVKSDDDVNLVWDQALLADKYYYEVSDSSSFSNIVASGYTDDTVATVSGLLNNTTYYWRVTAYNESKEMGRAWTAKQEYAVFSLGQDEYSVKNIKFYDGNDQEISNISGVTSAAYVTYDFINNTESSVNYDLILAVFDKSGKAMKNVIIYARNQSGDVGSNAKNAVINAPATFEEDDIILAFIWKSDNISPLTKQKIIR